MSTHSVSTAVMTYVYASHFSKSSKYSSRKQEETMSQRVASHRIVSRPSFCLSSHYNCRSLSALLCQLRMGRPKCLNDWQPAMNWLFFPKTTEISSCQKTQRAFLDFMQCHHEKKTWVEPGLLIKPEFIICCLSYYRRTLWGKSSRKLLMLHISASLT